jgi:hypothetical protein
MSTAARGIRRCPWAGSPESTSSSTEPRLNDYLVLLPTAPDFYLLHLSFLTGSFTLGGSGLQLLHNLAIPERATAALALCRLHIADPSKPAMWPAYPS